MCVATAAAAAAGPVGAIEAPRLDSFPAAKASEVRWWRLQRLKLLALNDRLETCVVSGSRCGPTQEMLEVGQQVGEMKGHSCCCEGLAAVWKCGRSRWSQTLWTNRVCLWCQTLGPTRGVCGVWPAVT